MGIPHPWRALNQAAQNARRGARGALDGFWSTPDNRGVAEELPEAAVLVAFVPGMAERGIQDGRCEVEREGQEAGGRH